MLLLLLDKDENNKVSSINDDEVILLSIHDEDEIKYCYQYQIKMN